MSLASPDLPCPGKEWRACVDVTSHPAAYASFVWASDAWTPGSLSPHGELLVALSAHAPLFRSIVRSSGDVDVHTFAIPPLLAGRSLSLQALILADHGGSLTNALDVVVASP